ncbi:hypothetical protein FHX74_001669 [Friedmanniella endophytica]|uniref:Uncharacterized protein n=1 Tax=Microlunatus kandeliicorticis TaxID=1759536 RepID=A0A7W3IRR9_9ACTN|nr:hypothetical protein [Microlunatus kandeliicorticis]MBA8794064.1 hypothetical protein [Microlunatus kandeliicorticis]
MYWHRRKPTVHPLNLYAQTSVYSMAFSLAAGVDLSSAAERLLRVGWARTSTTPAEASVRVAHRFKYVEKSQRDLDSIIDFMTRLNDQEVRMSSLLTAHPLLSAKIFLPALLRRKNIDAKEERSGSGRYDAQIAELASLRQAAAVAVEEAQILGGLRNAVDQFVYSYGYLESEPYVRLQARPAFVRWADDGVDGEPRQVMVWLTLHRSGAAILTLVFPNESLGDVGHLTALSSVTTQFLREVEVSSDIVGQCRPIFREKRLIDGVEQPAISEGAKTVVFSPAEDTQEQSYPFAPEDLGVLYLDSLLSVLGLTTSYWLWYTTLFCDGQKGCCLSLVEDHKTELGSVISRLGKGEVVLRGRALDEVLEDVMFQDSESLWLAVGNALHVRRRASTNVLFSQFAVVSAIEQYLLQFWQLTMIDEATSNPSQTRRKLLWAQMQLAAGLVEYKRRFHSQIQLQAVVDRLLGMSNADQLYERLKDRVNGLHAVSQAFVAEKRDRRAGFFTLLGLIGTVVFGLPALRDAITIVSGMFPQESVVVQFTQKTGGASALAVYTVALAALFLLIVAIIQFLGLQMHLPRRQSKKLAQIGIQWSQQPFNVVPSAHRIAWRHPTLPEGREERGPARSERSE